MASASAGEQTAGTQHARRVRLTAFQPQASAFLAAPAPANNLISQATIVVMSFPAMSSVWGLPFAT